MAIAKLQTRALCMLWCKRMSLGSEFMSSDFLDSSWIKVFRTRWGVVVAAWKTFKLFEVALCLVSNMFGSGFTFFEWSFCWSIGFPNFSQLISFFFQEGFQLWSHSENEYKGLKYFSHKVCFNEMIWLHRCSETVVREILVDFVKMTASFLKEFLQKENVMQYVIFRGSWIADLK